MLRLCTALALLASWPKAPAQDGMPALCHAAWKGDLAAAKAELARGADLELSYQFQTPLMWAAKMGHPEVAALLIEAGAKVNQLPEKAQGFTALRYAVSSGQTAIAERLLAAGADPTLGADSWYGTLAHLAARNSSPELIELLARAQVPLDEDSAKINGTPLHVAAFAGRGRVLTALLAHGARVDARGDLARTPLHLAAHAGHRECVQLLLEHGANALLQDELGRTPAHLACEDGNDGALEELRWEEETQEWSKSLTLPDKHGLTALHLAAAFGHPDCMALVLPAELRLALEEVETLSESGRSALHWAYVGGAPACIELALDAGLSPDTADELGLRPEELQLSRTLRQVTAPEQASELAPLAADKGLPAIRVYEKAGYSIAPVSGLGLAVWPDGVVLFAPERSSPGQDLCLGRIPASAVEQVLSVCAELGLFDRPGRSEVGMHSSSTSVTLRHEDHETQLIWDKDRSDSSWYASSSRRSFVNTWDLMEAQLRSLVPSTSLPLAELVDDGRFRGQSSR